MSLPQDLLYSIEHVWVKVEDNVATVGITEHAQSELGDIVFIELPATGEDVIVSEPFGSAESVKTVSELYAPISGTVIEVNAELEDSPELVNESPFEKAWMIKIEVTDESQLEELLDAKSYQEKVEEM
ncbi:glycine cleavage system protein GcvH [Saliterribacillus persicus]|uniref:Glycine cleavage system H protein n=1 Tax=Saliterribacillus persicus TaxID=930114 RepID=A0A368XG61_9BACI|nr:glycine cleavage system protein GcvH [Saliterribacillus persicus]RCW66980.1 glycine cleavage system H protein [Saliterribacillus persicus]